MKVLCIGDVFGKPGRQALSSLLPKIVNEEGIDFVICNAENAAGGKGITDKIAEELFKLPIDAVTAGNHIWEHKSIHPYFESHLVLRPLNVIENLPGRGYLFRESKNGFKIAVICLQGEIFMDDKGPKVSNPFRAVEELLLKIRQETKIIFVDFHAEATSEKRCMGWLLDGKVTALVGTHTHIQTSDEEILPNGTAYITDLGMTGPHGSVIGLAKEVALKRFLSGERKGYEVAKDDVRLEGVIVEIDEKSGLSKSIKRIRYKLFQTV